ncbi:hypothetical protein [Streptomyces galilaeus]
MTDPLTQVVVEQLLPDPVEASRTAADPPVTPRLTTGGAVS